MILCSSCVKSFLFAKDRAELLQRSLIPPSGAAFFPTEAQTLSASIFACYIHNAMKLQQKLKNRDSETGFASMYLLTELFEIRHNTVAEAIFHAVC